MRLRSGDIADHIGNLIIALLENGEVIRLHEFLRPLVSENVMEREHPHLK